jgi:CheY-like chemotaxis protein
MDVGMPEVEGLEATRRIRVLAGARGQVPVVAVTAHVFTDQIEECRKAGMDSHMAKPFIRDTLIAALAREVAAGQRRGLSRPAHPDSAGQPQNVSSVLTGL